MTQNMEKYSGFSIVINEELDAEKLDQLQKIAPQFMRRIGIDPEEYYLYCHQTLIIPISKHWARNIPIHERIESLNIKFSVNQKQLPKAGTMSEGRIQFYNWRCSDTPIENLLGMTLDEHIQYYPSPYEMTYSLAGDFIETHKIFKNLLLTVIDKNLREAHRKIKLLVSVIPTEEYRKKLIKIVPFEKLPSIAIFVTP
jgi:hypothetical protein